MRMGMGQGMGLEVWQEQERGMGLGRAACGLRAGEPVVGLIVWMCPSPGDAAYLCFND